MTHPSGDSEYATSVRQVDGFRDRYSKHADISTSTTIEDAFSGLTLVDKTDVGCHITSNGTLQYEPNGTAGATSGFLPTNYTVMGLDEMKNMQLFAASATTVSLIVFEARS